MKRFTETNKWQDHWFRRLSGPAKVLWSYICDQCDAAGVIDLYLPLVAQDTGIKIAESHLQELESRIAVLPSGKIWVTGFIKFQYGKLSRDCKPHSQVFACLEKHGIPDEAATGNPMHSLPKGMHTLHKGSESLKDKDKDKDKDKGEGEGEDAPPAEPTDPLGNPIPEVLRNTGVIDAIERWHRFKREKRQGYQKTGAVGFLARLSNIRDPTRIIRAVDHSIANNYTGIFEPNEVAHNASKPNPRNAGLSKEFVANQPGNVVAHLAKLEAKRAAERSANAVATQVAEAGHPPPKNPGNG